MNLMIFNEFNDAKCGNGALSSAQTEKSTNQETCMK